MRRFEDDAGERLHRVGPAAVDTDVELARLAAVHGQPVDELRVRRAAEPVQQGLPCLEQVDPPGERVARTLDPGAALASPAIASDGVSPNDRRNVRVR